MLKKAELRRLPKLALTNKIKSLVATKSKKIDYYGKPYKGLYRYYLRTITTNLIFKASVFDAEWIEKGIKTPVFDIFIDTDQDTYISLEYDEKGRELRWRKRKRRKIQNPQTLIFRARRRLLLLKKVRIILERRKPRIPEPLIWVSGR